MLCVSRDKEPLKPQHVSFPPVPDALLHYCPSGSSTGNRVVVREGRQVCYSTSGSPDGEPVLWFVNLGLGRWLALLHHGLAEQRGLQLIVVDRPGMGRTDPLTCGEDRTLAVADDAQAVLNDLCLQRVRLLGSCAGTPYALAFLERHAEHVAGDRVAIGPAWVSPYDCEATSGTLRFASGAPSFLVRGVVALGQSLMSLSSMEAIAEGGDDKLTRQEQALLSIEERQRLTAAKVHLLNEGFSERGNSGAVRDDADVCLGTVPKTRTQTKLSVCIFAGSCDDMVSLEASEWLANEFPNGMLRLFPNTSHMGLEWIPQRFETMLDWLVPNNFSDYNAAL